MVQPPTRPAGAAETTSERLELSPSEQGAIIELQRAILESVASSQEQREVADAICRLAERLLPNAVASLMLVGPEGRLSVYAAPSLTPEGWARLDGLAPGPEAGSCGNAVYSGEPVYVTDTLNDPRWAGLRSLARDFNLKACWSMPVKAGDGSTVGSFALSSFEHRAPSALHRAVLDIAARTIGIVLERRKQLDALWESEARYRQMFEVNQAIKLIMEPGDGRIVDANTAAVTFYGYPRARLLEMSIFDLNALPRDEVLGLMAGVAQGRQMHNVFPHRLASGEIRDVEVHSGPVSQRGRTLLYSILHDVTARRQAEAALRQERDFVSAILDSVGSAILVLDREGRVVRFNHKAEAASGYQFDEIEGRDFFRTHLLEAEQEAPVRRVFESIFSDRHPSHGEYAWVGRDGGRRLFDWVNTPLAGPDGAPAYVVAIGTDITERKRTEEELQLAASVYANTQEGILVTDPEGTVLDVNPAFSEITGYARGEILGANPHLLASGRHEDAFFAEMWRQLAETGRWSGEIWNRRPDGEAYPVWLTVSAVKDGQGAVRRYVGVLRDITLAKSHEEALEHQAHFDALTGLPNRVLLADRMSQAIARCRRTGQMVGVVYVDLDGFKAVNDGFGHRAGDQVLVAVSRRIEQVLRADDTVARLGGDEFVVLLPALDSLDQAQTIVERIQKAIAPPIRLPHEGAIVSVAGSAGLSLYPLHSAEPDTLLRLADQAMYRAKEAGPGGFQIHDGTRSARGEARRQLLLRLERALSQGELTLYYQPRVNLRTGETLGVEALLRWQDPDEGLLLPCEFLPRIENSNLELRLDNWVIDTALAQAEAWREKGIVLAMAVNINGRQLLHDDFPARLAESLARHPGVPASVLEIEVLESAALTDLARILRVVERCRALGVRFALDDFGTGFASLAHLRQLPAGTLKIDRAFVSGMLHDPADLAIIEGVIALASAFDRTVVAEGVESREQGEALLRIGCDQAQGFAIAPPMPAADMPAWLQGRGRNINPPDHPTLSPGASTRAAGKVT